MKLAPLQVLDVSSLYGAYIENENGAPFYIVSVGVDIAGHEIFVELQDADAPENTAALPWETIRNWEVQLRPHRHPPSD